MRFCFEAQSWKEAIHVSVELTQVHRQRDSHFATMLNELRRGIVSPDSERMLVACTRNDFFAAETSPASPAPRGGSSPVPPAEAWVEPTRLYSTNKNVDELNHQRLSALPGKGQVLPSPPSLFLSVHLVPPAICTSPPKDCGGASHALAFAFAGGLAVTFRLIREAVQGIGHGPCPLDGRAAALLRRRRAEA